MVMCKLSGTISNIEGFSELPMFPGIPSMKLKGKKFVTRAFDIQIIKDRRIIQGFHIEDWAAALDQMLNGNPPYDFGSESSDELPLDISTSPSSSLVSDLLWPEI